MEQGLTAGPELMAAAHEYLDPVRDAGVDTLVLGCTHCPLLTGAIDYRVLAFNFNPMHRDLNHSDYRFLWNGILNWSALPPAQP